MLNQACLIRTYKIESTNREGLVTKKLKKRWFDYIRQVNVKQKLLKNMI